MSEAESGTCAFSFDIAEWYEDREERLGEDENEDDLWEFDERFLEDGEWHCYRRTRPGEHYCLFHAHESDGEIESVAEPGEVLRDIINASTDDRQWNAEVDGLWEVPRHPPEREEPFGRDEFKRREKQFVGASLGEVQLSYEDLDGPDSYPIDIRLGTAESVDLSRSRVGHNLWLAGFEQTAVLDDDDEHGIDLYKTRIEGTLWLPDANLKDNLRLEEAKARVVTLNRAVVHGNISAAFLDSSSIKLKNARVKDGDLSASAVISSESLRFRGAHIDGDVSLNRADVNHKISLSDAWVGGEVNLEDADTGRSVWFKDAEIESKISLNRASIGNNIILEDATAGGVAVKYANVAGSVDLTDATVEIDADDADASVALHQTGVSRDLKLNGATVEERLDITHAKINGRIEAKRNLTVGGTVSFKSSQVDDTLYLGGSDNSYGELKFPFSELELVAIGGEVFDGGISFKEASIVDGFGLDEATVFGDVNIENTQIVKGTEGKALDIYQTEVTGSISVESTEVRGAVDMRIDGVSVGGSVHFEECLLDGDLLFGGVDIDGTVSVIETDIENELYFSSKTEIGGRLDLSDTDVPELIIDCTLTHPAISVVSLERTTVDSATLDVTLEDDGIRPVYDLKDATVGDIPPMRKHEAFREQNAFEKLRFLGTTFDGFVFSEHREQFRETDWQAHRPRDGGYEDIAIATGSIKGSDDLNGVVFEVAQDIAEAASGAAILDAIEESAEENTDEESEHDSLLAAEDTPTSTVTTYLENEFDSAEASRPEGDPFSLLAGLFESSPDPQHDPSREWRAVAEERIDDLEKDVRERLDIERVYRASLLPYSATERVDTLRELLDDAIRDPTAGDESAPTGSLPVYLDSDRDASLTVDRLVTAVMWTMALSPSLATEIAATTVTTGEGQSVADGGMPDPVVRLCEAWDVSTGNEATAFETAVSQALAAAGEPIVEIATAIRDDHERLVELGLVSEEAAGDTENTDGPHPYGAVADAIVDYEAVSDAEFVADELDKDDPRYRRILDRYGISLEAVEEAVARDLVDYRMAMGTNNKLESTYALAKNGASEAGDETAAGNFFRREAGYARRQHWQRLGGSSTTLKLLIAMAIATGALVYGSRDIAGLLGGSLPAPSYTAVLSFAVAFVVLYRVRRELGQFLKWAGNVFLMLTMGYGEKPTRVLGFSGVIICVFALAYRGLGADVTPTAGSVDLGYLVFSLDVFVTLALSSPTGGDQLIRLLAVLEGFIGVFVIGMFVVTVTRAIHR